MKVVLVPARNGALCWRARKRRKNATKMFAVCLLHSAMAGARLPESVCLQDGSVRYFAFGSNLLRSKMVGCATHQPTHDS